MTWKRAAKRFRGMKLAECLDILEQETSIRLPATFASDLRQAMQRKFEAELQPIPGVLRLIESMQTLFCVASNGPVAKIENNLRLTGLFSPFVGKIFSAYELRSWKPEPGLFLHAAAHFGIAPEDCVVVEDSYLGVQAGLAANMQVLALDAFATGEQLSGAKKVFADIEAIQEYFAERGWARY